MLCLCIHAFHFPKHFALFFLVKLILERSELEVGDKHEVTLHSSVKKGAFKNNLIKAGHCLRADRGDM